MQTLETRLPDLDDAKPQYEPDPELDADDDSDDSEDSDEKSESEAKPTLSNRQVRLTIATGIFTGWGPRMQSHGGPN